MARRIAGLATAAALQLIALVLAHELVFVARYGSRYGEALVHSGHGTAWNNAVLSSVALAGFLALLAAVQIVRLGVVAGRAGASGGRRVPLELRVLAGSFLTIGPRTAAISVVSLTIQENVERLAIGAVAPGPGILLSAEYPFGLWITIGVGLLVGLVVSLFAWRRRALLARIRAAAARLPRASTGAILRPRVRVPALSGSLLGRKSALRAPPIPSAV